MGMADGTYADVCGRLWAYFGGAGAGDACGVPDGEALALGVFAGLYREGFRLGGKQVCILGGGDLAGAIADCFRSGGAAGVTTADAGQIPEDGAAYYVRLPGGWEPALTDLTGAEGVCDLTVSPLRSRLLLDAEEADLLTSGGVYPLAAAVGILRGRAAGTAPDPTEVEAVVRRYLRGSCNLVVTGLRGDGVEAVAEALSRLSRRPLVRVGRGEVSEKCRGAAGKLFLAEEGIAADGEALLPIAENGRCVFVAPPLDTLKEGEGNPALAARYRGALGTYTAFCDRTFEHAGDPADTARRILDDFLRTPYLKRSR